MKRTLSIFAGILVALAIFVFFFGQGGSLKTGAKNPQAATATSAPAKAAGGSMVSTSRSHSQPESASQAAPSSVQLPSSAPVVAEPHVPQKSVAKAGNITGTSRTSEINGERVSAQVVTADGSPRTFSPNSLGLFPRVVIGLEETVQVAVDYPEGTPGDPVTLQSEDGGSLDGKNIVMQSQLDDNRQVRFAFTSTQEGGIYRVTLRKGFDEKRLEFWGGTEPALQKSNP